jgi:protein TonB
VHRFDQRQGFIVSAVIHLTLLMIVIAHPPFASRRQEDVDPSTLERKERVFLPPNSVLKQIIKLAPKSARPTPPPNAVAQARPVPPPPPPQGKDRISVGPPSELHAKGPMVLERDQDLTKVAKGRPDAGRPTPPPPPPPAPQSGPAAAAAGSPRDARTEIAGRPGLQLPPGLNGAGTLGDGGQRGREGRPEPTLVPGGGMAGPTSFDRSARAAMDQVARRMRQEAQLGIPTGTGKDLGGLYFDPQGADFTLWIQHWKDEVYRNWIVPQSVFLGFRGHVDIEFTVERDGTISSVRLVKSAGTASLDRAAQNALTSSRLLRLPDDYGPPRLVINVTFFYNEGPQGS